MAKVCDAPVELVLGVVPAMVAVAAPEDEPLEPLELELEFVLELEPPPHAAMVASMAKTMSASPMLR
jgi:hypothetical protein